MPAQLIELLHNTALVSLITGVLGFLLANFIVMARGRVRSLEYTVTHERVGISAQDAVFGDVVVNWHDTPVVNLYLSTVTLENTTVTNFTNLKFKVFTGETLLLNSSGEIEKTTIVPPYTAEYQAAIALPPGEAPTAQQQHRYWHNREYGLAVFNRRQRVILRYLTTTHPNANASPAVWIDMQHPGATVRYRPNEPLVHGVPVKYAAPIDLTATALVLIVGARGGSLHTWVAAVVAMIAGLFAQSIGAGLFRFGRLLYRIVFQ